MRIEDQLNSEQKQKLKALNKKSKPPSKKKKQRKPKEERVNWAEIMGMSRPTYKRVRGKMHQK